MAEEKESHKGLWIGLGIVALVIVVIIVSAANSSPATQQDSLSNEGANPNIQTQSPAPTAPQPLQVPINQIQVTNLTLGNNNGFVGHDLDGTVTNNSDYPINYIELTVEAYDCPGEVIDSGCSHIGEDKGVDLFINGDVYAQIPPGQIREMSSALVDLSGMPPIQGNFLWSYTITGVYQYSP